jgi:putative toxin-antitoxin system antitoxin component (TIGR02293 family)
VERKCHIAGYFWQMAQTVRRTPAPVSGFAEDASQFVVEQNRVSTEALNALSRYGYREDEIFALVVPKRTLARRKAANEPLTVEETDKLLRLERIASQAKRVFGAPEKAWRWLREPKRALQGETPVAHLASEAGARDVEEMLARIEHGMFA